MGKIFEQGLVYISIVFLFVFLCGKSACQEDYFLADQSSATATATPTETDDDGTGSNTATATATTTATSESATATPTATSDSASASASTVSDQSLLNELASLSQETEPTPEGKKADNLDKKAALQSGSPENWLGKAFSDDDAPSAVDDNDGDGFITWLEDEAGTDPNNARSVPLSAIRTSLQLRFQAEDRDYDGLSKSQEAELGTDPNFPDSDDDGFLDGIEFLSDTDPNDAKSRQIDSDKDGVGDELEVRYNTDGRNRDSDRDGLKDDLEIILGTSSASPDSDNDGILDGREYEFGSDPLISERQ